MRERILPAGPSPGAGIVFADARGFAHDGQRGSAGELRREQRVIARIGGSGRSVPSRWKEQQRRWGPRSPSMNSSKWKRAEKWLPPCTWEWMELECRCAPKKSRIAPASKPTAQPKPESRDPRFRPCGRESKTLNLRSSYTWCARKSSSADSQKDLLGLLTQEAMRYPGFRS
jgi:hypothetical protein